MAFLNSMQAFFGATAVTVTAPGGMWEWFIQSGFALILNYGLRIIVLTVVIKLVLFPVDLYQKFMLDKNMRITARLKPTMDKLQKQYGDNKAEFSQKQMALNRKEGYSYFSSCLPAILTLVVFMTLWMGMRNVAEYMTFKEYADLYNQFQTTYSQEVERGANDGDAIAAAQNDVYTLYYEGLDGKDPVQSKFLWIKNIWVPDVPWGDQAILSYSAFSTAAGGFFNNNRITLVDESGKAIEDTEQAAEVFTNMKNESTYNSVMHKLLNNEEQSRVNGYLVIPILVVGLSFLSTFVTSRQQKKAGQQNAQGQMQGMMKAMMFIMPIMMAVFACMYSAAFSIYMLMNSAMTLILNFSSTGIVALVNKYKTNRVAKTLNVTSDKAMTKGTYNVASSGRPDPEKLLAAAKANSEKKKKKSDAIEHFGDDDE